MFVHESVTGFQTGVQIVPSPATGEWHSWLWTWASRLMRVVGEELSILLYIFWFSLFFCHYMYLLILEEPNVNMTRSCLSAEPELPVSGRAPAESGSLHEPVMGTVDSRVPARVMTTQRAISDWWFKLCYHGDKLNVPWYFIFVPSQVIGSHLPSAALYNHITNAISRYLDSNCILSAGQS